MLSFRTGIKRLCALSLCVCLILSVSFFTSGHDRELTDTWENRLNGMFVTSELIGASVNDFLEAMRSGRMTSVELTGMYLKRIESYDSSLGINAIITVNPDALAEAAAADEARSSGAEGRLLGIPVIVSDSIDVQGMPTTNGDSARLGGAASADSEVVRRLREEGAVIIGKANISEDPDDEYITRSSAGGTSRNPYDLSLTTGGTAGGSAAAVASDFAAVAIAVESGASVRIPASFTGLYAIRPSYGIVGRTGSGLIDTSEDVIGVLGGSPEDAALVLDIISGTDPSDGSTAEAQDIIPDDGYVTDDPGVSLEGVRIGYLSNSFGYYVNSEGKELDYPDTLSGDVREMLDSTLSLFTSNGAELVDLSRYLTEEYLNRLGNVSVSFSRRVISELFEDYEIDTIVYLSQLNGPESIGYADGDYANPADYLHIIAPRFGLPETVVPMVTETEESRLPLGISMIGKYGDDAKLLSIACSYHYLAGQTPAPSYVPALPDDGLHTLGTGLVRAADILLKEQTLSQDHREKISSLMEELSSVSMTGEKDTAAVSVAEYRKIVSELGSIMDAAELIISPAPVKNIVTLRYFVQKYRAAVSVSSVSVLLFAFAMILAGPGKRQRQTFIDIPNFDVSENRSMSFADRIRSAGDTMRERRRLLREARKALRNNGKKGGRTAAFSTSETVRRPGFASRIGAAGNASGDSGNDTRLRFRRSLELFADYLHRPFNFIYISIKKISSSVASLLKPGTSSDAKELKESRAEREQNRRESAARQKQIARQERQEQERLRKEKELQEKAAAAAVRKAEQTEARKEAVAARSDARRAASARRVERIRAFLRAVSGFFERSISSLRSRFRAIEASRMAAKNERLEKRAAASEERKTVREQKKADRIISQRIKNAQRVDAREKLLAQKTARKEEIARAKAALLEEKRQKQENRKISRAKTAAINAERRAAERFARKERFASLITSVAKTIVSVLASVFAALSAGMLSIRNRAAESAETRKNARAEARALRLEKEAVRIKERRLRKEARQAEAYAAQQKRQAVLQKKQAAENERILLRARYDERRKQQEKEWAEARVIQRKERAAAALLKKKEKAEKKAEHAAEVKAAAAERAEIRNLKKAEKNAVREQKAITKAANEQFRLLERKKVQDAERERKAAAKALRLNQIAEKRKLKDEKRIEKKAAALFRKKQRQQNVEEFRKAVRSSVKSFFNSFRERAEQRKIRRAEELFLRNNELREQKRRIEDLKAEQLRIEEETRILAAAQQEKKAQAENARKEAAVAYRAMVDRKISEQVEYLEEKSARKREADLEYKRKKEEKQKEKAAQKAAEDARRKEEKARLQKEKEEMQQARELAAAQRKEKERQLKEEKKTELARLDFEKNKDKIIKAQRREIQKNERIEKRRASRMEAAAKRYERNVILRTKVSLFLGNIPYKLASIPYRIESLYKRLEDRLTGSFATSISQISDQSEKAKEARVMRAEERVEQREAAAQIRREKKEEAARAKEDRKEAAAVAARLKKQEANDRRARAEKAKEQRRQEKLSKQREKKAMLQAKARRRVAAVRNAFTSVGKWVSGIFSTTQNWLKRVFLLVTGVVRFIVLIPVRAVRALLSIPGRISISLTASKEKRLAKAEAREYKLEQRRIAREKELVSGKSNVTAVPADQTDTSQTASGSIRNLEKEAPFTYSQRSFKDLIRPCRGQIITAFISSMLQAAGIVVMPELITDLMISVRTFNVEDMPYELAVKALAIFSACLLAHIIGRTSVSSMLRTVSKEMRRIEFSIRKDRDTSVSLESDILRMQEIVFAEYDFVFDISVLVAAVVAACLSSLLSIAVLATAALIAVRNARSEEKRLGKCRNVEEAVTVREAVSLDWARKLRVNKLLGRGNDSYDNVRNAVLDVNIRVLARRDVETDHDTAFRTVCYIAIAGIAIVSLFLPLGETTGQIRHLIAAAASLIVVPAAIQSAADKFRILSDRHDLSKTVSSLLTDDKASGDIR